MFVYINEGAPEKIINIKTFLKKNYPNVSFPDVISNELLASYNIFPLTLVNPPVNIETQIKTYQGISQIDGVWTETWVVRDKTPQELELDVIMKKDEAQTEIESNLSALKALARGLHDHENRIRALEGNANTVTFAQVVQWLLNKL